MAEKLIVDNFYEDLLDLASEVFESRFAMSEAEAEARNCGTGAGGFKFGNKCALGGAWWAANGGKGVGPGDEVVGVINKIGENSSAPKNAGEFLVVTHSKVSIHSMTLSDAVAAHGAKVEAFRKRMIEIGEKKDRAVEATKKAFLDASRADDKARNEYLLHVNDAKKHAEKAEEWAHSPPSYARMKGWQKESEEKAEKALAALKEAEGRSSKALKDWYAARDDAAAYYNKALSKQSLEVDLEDGFTLKEHTAAKTVTKMIAETGVNVEPMSKARLDAHKEAQNQRNKAMDMLASTANPMMHADALATPITYNNGTNFRAYAQGSVAYSVKPSESGGEEPHRAVASSYNVALGTSSDSSTFVHEFGHAIEHANAEVAKMADDFLQSRVGNEKPMRLSKIAPGYGKDETGRSDDFQKAFDAVHGTEGNNAVMNKVRACYAGRNYPGQGDYDVRGFRQVGRTEVLSMGLELLHKNPVAFAKADPEWFNFTVGVTSGRYLTHTRAKRIVNKTGGSKSYVGPLTTKYEGATKGKDGVWTTPDGESFPVFSDRTS